MQRTHDASAGQRLGCAIFFTQRHQTGHFGLSDVQFFATECGQSDVFYDIIKRHPGGSSWVDLLDGGHNTETMQGLWLRMAAAVWRLTLRIARSVTIVIAQKTVSRAAAHR